jgi:hypothetical protein
MKDAALYRFKTVYQLRDCAVAYDVTRILDKVVVKKIFYVSHLESVYRINGKNERREYVRK